MFHFVCKAEFVTHVVRLKVPSGVATVLAPSDVFLFLLPGHEDRGAGGGDGGAGGGGGAGGAEEAPLRLVSHISKQSVFFFTSILPHLGGIYLIFVLPYQ